MAPPSSVRRSCALLRLCVFALKPDRPIFETLPIGDREVPDPQPQPIPREISQSQTCKIPINISPIFDPPSLTSIPLPHRDCRWRSQDGRHSHKRRQRRGDVGQRWGQWLQSTQAVRGTAKDTANRIVKRRRLRSSVNSNWIRCRRPRSDVAAARRAAVRPLKAYRARRIQCRLEGVRRGRFNDSYCTFA